MKEKEQNTIRSLTKKKYVLINPRVTIQKNDFLGSGVPYLPIDLVTFGTFLQEKNYEINIIDLFGENPFKLEEAKNSYLQGESIKKFFNNDKYSNIDTNFIIYASSFISHNEILNIIRYLNENLNSKIIVLENSQAVTGYAISHKADDFFQAGAEYLICGQPYFNWDEIDDYIDNRTKHIPTNIITSKKIFSIKRKYTKDFKYPIPNWDLINYKNYWKLPYSHGPKTKKYLPIITSRGCPYPCDFCVVPETNNKKWNANTPNDVVNEIIYLRDKYNVNNFQVEDLNPTVSHKRWEVICDLLIKRNAKINFYICSGTKAETIKINSVKKLAKAGCKFVSISPEYGNQKIMKKIGKRFNYDHGEKLIKELSNYGIYSQACFLVGHPDETKNDINDSISYIKKLVKNGLSEIAVFIVSPFAGSKIYKDKSIKINEDEIVSFSPIGRNNYSELQKSRYRMIKTFFFYKLITNLSLQAQFIRSIFFQPRTKIENTVKRVMFIYFLIFKNKINFK